jgi:putative glutamine amidotransferase
MAENVSRLGTLLASGAVSLARRRAASILTGDSEGDGRRATPSVRSAQARRLFEIRGEQQVKNFMRPVVGVIGNAHLVNNRFAVQQVGEKNLRAVAEVSEALPLMFAGAPDITDIGALLEVVDGVLLTGARANVHPARFHTEPHPGHEPYDEDRDALALALIEACVARGVPIFGVCRGFQEMNVAFGGSLHPEIRELPGRMNHRMPRLETGEIHPDPAVVFADRHDVRLVPGGAFATLLGRETIRVNSLHGQGILEPGERVVVEGVAEDGTIEAIRIAGAPGFALGVQWHAEYDPQCNPVNRCLFQAFGEALSANKGAGRAVRLSRASLAGST